MSDNSTPTVPETQSEIQTETSAEEINAIDPTVEPEIEEEEESIAVNDLGMSFADAIQASIVEFDDGDLVKGTVVKIDKDEVLLDIGFKSEGVIPTKELSIRNDVDPFKEVELGEELEVLVLTKEDKDGRLILSKKRAQYEKAWTNIEEIKNANGVVKGLAIEVVKGGVIVDIGLRGFLPASLVDTREFATLHLWLVKKSNVRFLNSTETVTMLFYPEEHFWKKIKKATVTTSLNILKLAKLKKESFLHWCHSVHSLTSVVWTGLFTFQNFHGSTLTLQDK